MPSSSSRHPRRALSLPLLLLTVLALVLGTFSVAAHAATVTVSGKVLGQDGAPLSGVVVKLGDRENGAFKELVAVAGTTDANGAWSTTLDDATRSTYLVGYTAPGYDPAYLRSGGDATTDLAQATYVTVTGGATGVDEKLVAGSAELSGVVTRKGSLAGDPVAGATVTLSRTGTTPRQQTTDAKGAYRFDDLLPGSYQLSFARTGYRTHHYLSSTASTADPAAAGSVTLADKQSASTVHGFLTQTTRSQMGGTVVTTDGTPVKDAEIRVFTRRYADGDTGAVSHTQVDADGKESSEVSDTTGVEGRWLVDQVFGDYVVEVKAPAFGTYYFDNGSMSQDRSRAALVRIEEGTARPLDARLDSRSTTTIQGIVRDAGTEQPVKGVTISVETGTTDASGQPVWTEAQKTQATTGADGFYSAEVPPGGGYVVGFHAPGYRPQFFERKGTRSEATRVETSFATPRGGVNAQLERVAQVVGTVRDTTGQPVQGVTVTPVVLDTATGEWVPADFAEGTTTGRSGAYAVSILDAGLEEPFRLRFEKPGRETRWFPAATVADEGQNLSVAKHQVLSGRDVTLPTLAVLAGALTEADGSAYDDGGEVSLWRKVSYTEQGERGGPAHTEWRPVAAKPVSGSDGSFSFSVPSGSYRMLARLTGENDGFLPGLVGLDQAPDISLAPEQSRTLQTYALPPVSAVRGTVTTTTGAPARGETVRAHYRFVQDIRDGAPVLSSWRLPAATAPTTTDGTYELEVRARTYRVGVPGKGFHTVDGTPQETLADADDVTLGSVAATGVDVRLSDGRPVNLAPPWIAGQAVEGGTLTAKPGTWSAADVTYAYQWFQSDTAAGPWTRASGTSDKATYEIPSATPIIGTFDAKHYLVHLTARRATGDVSEAASSKPTGKAKASPFYAPADPTTENRQDPQVTGRAVVGETLTGTTGEWSKGGTFELQWLADGQAVAGATTSSLRLGAAQLGRKISLKVTETTNEPDRVAVSRTTVAVVRGSLRATTLPSVTGQPFVGKPLTAHPGTWNADAPTFAYQWLVDGRAVPGATGTTYTPGAADEGKPVAVRVAASVAQAMDPGTATSESTALVAPDPTTVSNRTAPRITGTPQVGQTLSTTEGSWTNEPTSFSYQWLADGVAIGGATRSTHELGAAEAGKLVTVRVTASKAGLTSGTATADPVGPVASGPLTNTALPVVSGTAAPGGTLSTTDGTWDPATGLTYSYQWLADGTPVAGATSSSIVVTESLVGKAVAAVVTARRGSDSASATSKARTVAAEPVEPVEVLTAPSVSGRAEVGQEVVVDTGTTDPAGATRAVQWLRDGQAVPGAIGTRYRPTGADLGTILSARVTYTHPERAEAVRTVTAGTVREGTTGPEKPRLDVVKRTKGTKLVLKVAVLADAVDTVPGELVLKENRRTLARKSLTGGTHKIVVRGLSRGFHTVRVKFLSGSEDVRNAKKTISFRIR